MIDAPFDYVKKANSRRGRLGEGFAERGLKWTTGAVFSGSCAPLGRITLCSLTIQLADTLCYSRLPAFSDMEDLPCVHALTKAHPSACPIKLPRTTSMKATLSLRDPSPRDQLRVRTSCMPRPPPRTSHSLHRLPNVTVPLRHAPSKG